MNTGPLTFNIPTYTVLGGMEKKNHAGIAAVLLNIKGSYSRRSYFYELEKVGFDEVLSIENPGEHYEIEELSGLFPSVRFILLKEEISVGQKINIAALELASPLFFVLRDDLHILHDAKADQIAAKLLVGSPTIEKINESWYKRLCTVPIIQNAHYDTIPTSTAPVPVNNLFKPLQFAAAKEGDATLYPYAACGIYDRQRFINLGGFDTDIKSSYWQLMDFGLRAWLWGQEIRSTQQIRLKIDGNPALSNTSGGEDYRQFFLKNIAPVVDTEKSSGAHLPLRLFFPFALKSGGGFFAAIKDFFSARKWVEINSNNFIYDANSLEKIFYV